MSRVRFAPLALLAAATAMLVGCGAQDGLGAAGEQAASPTARVSLPNDAAPAPAATEEVVAAGLPCPSSDAQRQPARAGLPDLSLACLGPGGDVMLAGLPATPAVINVWATWCAPCRAEMPMLSALATAAGDDLIVLGVNVLDDKAAATEYAAGVPLASVYDPEGATRAALGWTGPPVTYFVGADGQIVHRSYGQIPSEASLRADVATYLGVQVGND